MYNRDQRFNAIHRGGTLTLDVHRLLLIWAADCAERVFSIFDRRCPDDDRPATAIRLARDWSRGEITVGAACNASVASHAAALDRSQIAATHAAGAAGHAVATAHMADHALAAAMYAIKAIVADDHNNRSAAIDELSWQRSRLTNTVCDLIQKSFNARYPALR
jgi:hypothetical protein